MTFVDKAYEHNLFKDNTSASRQHYSIGKWNSLNAVSNPNDKVNYAGSVKKFGMDYIDPDNRKKILSQHNTSRKSPRGSNLPVNLSDNNMVSSLKNVQSEIILNNNFMGYNNATESQDIQASPQSNHQISKGHGKRNSSPQK